MEGFKPEEVEKEIVEWLNKARADPKCLIPTLEERYATFKDKAWKKGDKWYNSREGNVAVKEAIEFLKEAPSLPALAISEGTQKAAAEHCEDMTKNGITGHQGSSGSTMANRIEKQGRWKGGVSENLAFQQTNGLDFVLYWVVDDGVKSRADRKNLFNPAFGVCGVSCGIHPKFKTCSVLLMTGELKEGETGKEATRLANEYEKSGYDQLGVNDQVFNYNDMKNTLQKDMAGDLKKDWIPGAVSMRQEKEIKKDGDKEVTIYTYIYTMGDGTIETRTEEIEGIVPNE